MPAMLLLLLLGHGVVVMGQDQGTTTDIYVPDGIFNPQEINLEAISARLMSPQGLVTQFALEVETQAIFTTGWLVSGAAWQFAMINSEEETQRMLAPLEFLFSTQNLAVTVARSLFDATRSLLSRLAITIFVFGWDTTVLSPITSSLVSSQSHHLASRSMESLKLRTPSQSETSSSILDSSFCCWAEPWRRLSSSFLPLDRSTCLRGMCIPTSPDLKGDLTIQQVRMTSYSSLSSLRFPGLLVEDYAHYGDYHDGYDQEFSYPESYNEWQTLSRSDPLLQQSDLANFLQGTIDNIVNKIK